MHHPGAWPVDHRRSERRSPPNLIPVYRGAARLRTVLVALLVAVSANATQAQAQDRPVAAAGKTTAWVSGWGTALDLAPPPPRPDGPPPGPPRRPPEAAAAAAPMANPMVPYPDAFENQTVRMVLQTTATGRAVRVQLANAQGKPPLRIDAAHIARRAADSAIVAGTDRPLTFGGKSGVTIPPGAIIVSDPAPLAVTAGEELAVSLYLPQLTGGVTAHALGLNSAYVAAGNMAAAPVLSEAKVLRSYFWLAGVEVLADRPRGVIVAFGDSITDGYATTPGAYRTWPEVFARRLRGDKRTQGWSVVNMGISGNRIRKDGTGASALARFDRDVLSRPGVKWIVMLEGINDINLSAIPGIAPSERTTAEEIIAAYGQFVAKAHLHGIKVMGATITPTEGLWLQTPQSEQMRQDVNRWIRTSGTFDAVVDFEAATRDPARPTRLRAEFDPGDHVHPNDAGTKAMADAIDLSHFR